MNLFVVVFTVELIMLRFVKCLSNVHFGLGQNTMHANANLNSGILEDFFFFLSRFRMMEDI